MAQTKIKLIADGVIDVNNLAAGHTITTDNIGEGSNLYYTDARVSNYLTTNSYATESFVTSGYLPLSGGNITNDLSVNTSTLFVDVSSNKVGIGTSVPITRAHVQNNALTGFQARTGATLTLENNAGTELYLASPSTAGGQIRFGDEDSNFRGAISYEHAGDYFIHYTAGAERMRIDASGNVGIGTSNPATKLEVAGNNNGVTTPSASTNIIRLSDLDTVSTAGQPEGAIEFYSADSSNPGVNVRISGICTYGGTVPGALVFETGTPGLVDERMRIDYAGNVGIGTSSPTDILHLNKTGVTDYNAVRWTNPNSTANFYVGVGGSGAPNPNLQNNAYVYNVGNSDIVVATNDTVRARFLAGGGLAFNNDTASANALDDYEEGTWSPTLPNGGTMTVLSAKYVKIGKQVTITFFIQPLSPTNNTNRLEIGGLPFIAGNTGTNEYFGGSFGYMGSSNLSNYLPIAGNGATFMYFHRSDGTFAVITNSNYLLDAGTTNAIIITMTYFTA